MLVRDRSGILKLFTMKLFYHFLVFVFVSLLLVACANIFTTDSKTSFSNKPSGLNHDNHSDNSLKEPTANVAERFKYKRFLKGRRWTDNQCYYQDILHFKSIQLAIHQIATVNNIYKN